MGDVVGAGLMAHVPTIMLPESERRELNHGQDTSLVAGLQRLRAGQPQVWPPIEHARRWVESHRPKY